MPCAFDCPTVLGRTHPNAQKRQQRDLLGLGCDVARVVGGWVGGRLAGGSCLPPKQTVDDS